MSISTESPYQTANFDLEELNQRFDTAHAREILAWCVEHIPNGLVQTSAFNVDDLIITDILYRELGHPVPVIFLDTLYHFPQTLELVNKAKDIYNLELKIYKIPNIDSRAAFASQYGEALWDADIAQFHQLTKIEPLQRGLAELNTIAWITGRRRDQATTRAYMPVFELDSKQRLNGQHTSLTGVATTGGTPATRSLLKSGDPLRVRQSPTEGDPPAALHSPPTQLAPEEAPAARSRRLKVNPLANWTRKQSWAYVAEHGVIYNPLHDQGYTSIGDEPITTPVAEGEDERAGRWRGTGKTECGIHI